MRLGVTVMPPFPHQSMGTRHYPRNLPHGYRFDRPEVWQQLVRTAERGGFDFVLLADTGGVYREYGASIGDAVEHAAHVPVFDATAMTGFLAAATSHVGIVATRSIAGTAPYVAARTLATLDHLSDGRIGWNVVTGHHRAAAENLGADDQTPHDLRYDMADEYVELCRRLWNGWKAGAGSGDGGSALDPRATPFVPREAVTEIDFEGRFYSSRGPLNVHPSPQRGPAIFQAGASPRGIRTGARWADAVMSVQPYPAGMVRYRDAVKAEAAAQGREPSEVAVLHVIQVFTGESDAIAAEKARIYDEGVDPVAGLVVLSGHLGFDLSTVPFDTPFASLDVPGGQGLIDQYARVDEARDITVGQVAERYGRDTSQPRFVGSGATVAAQLAELFDHVGGDGFIVSPAWAPGNLEDFVDFVVPELAARGLVRTSYTPGATLRDNLRDDTTGTRSTPATPAAATAHPATTAPAHPAAASPAHPATTPPAHPAHPTRPTARENGHP
ncbi:LLM class flavin-dependent oxidoreductase [Herbiconiux moechotypicola]|uniref:LLM class flavin-dependent oxidoreductase n=2 Tax=Herbiconiux moechotypicola TaxID=637393 RepID=A0ABP5Q4M7_9MICO